MSFIYILWRIVTLNVFLHWKWKTNAKGSSTDVSKYSTVFVLFVTLVLFKDKLKDTNNKGVKISERKSFRFCVLLAFFMTSQKVYKAFLAISLRIFSGTFPSLNTEAELFLTYVSAEVKG